MKIELFLIFLEKKQILSNERSNRINIIQFFFFPRYLFWD